MSGEGVKLSLPINESTPKKSFDVLNGDHGAGRLERTSHWHWNAGFLLGRVSEIDDRLTGLSEGRPPTSGQERRR